jgi:hypothetical protein
LTTASRTPNSSTRLSRCPLRASLSFRQRRAIANASFKQQQKNSGVTEIAQIPNRGHALTVDSGWREVADKALAFVQRFVRAGAK